MIALIHAFLLMIIIKGITYVFFPNWVKSFYSEAIIECPDGRLKWIGVLCLISSIVLWTSWARYL